MNTGVGQRLLAVHSGVVDTPLPESLENASCGPAVKHLAHLAMHTADAGGSATEWRTWVHEHVPEATETLLAEAEECMRDSGLWPWRD